MTEHNWSLVVLLLYMQLLHHNLCFWWYFKDLDYVQEFFHRQLHSGESDLPRISGMTASPIKSKGIGLKIGYMTSINYMSKLVFFVHAVFVMKLLSFDTGGKSESSYWKVIQEFETLMNSKVDSVHCIKSFLWSYLIVCCRYVSSSWLELHKKIIYFSSLISVRFLFIHHLNFSI